MTERSLHKLPTDPAPARYSTIRPPEVIERTKQSGVFKKIEETKKLKLETIHAVLSKVDGSKRRDWTTSGVLLQMLDSWNLLPPEIRNRESEESDEVIGGILDFLGSLNPETGKFGSLPEIVEIAIELGCAVLETIPEWNKLDRKTQFALEPEIITLVNQQHKEFEKSPSSRPKPLPQDHKGPTLLHGHELKVLLTPHHFSRQPQNQDEIAENNRQKIIEKISAKIRELAAEIAAQNTNLGETTFVDISKITETTARRAMAPFEAAFPPPLSDDENEQEN
jgi:hypothetical protein